MKFLSLFPTAASLTAPYSYTLVGQQSGTPAQEPFTFAVESGTLPPGLTLETNGVISGVAKQRGTYIFEVRMSAAGTGTPPSIVGEVVLPVIDVIQLADQTVDQNQFVAQFEQALAKSDTWSTGITSTTSQTLIEMVSALGSFLTARMIRVKEDSFPETAQSDTALRAIANMQGLRLTRKLPAQATFQFEANPGFIIPAFTKIVAGGLDWFCQDPINLNTAVTVTLKEGTVKQTVISGLGTEMQAWVSSEDKFVVSDQDIFVSINNQPVTRTYGGLWNYKGITACADTTLPDGKAVIQFGRGEYGAVPQVNDSVSITYITTKGSDVNNAAIIGAKVSVIGLPAIKGAVTSAPTGGASERDPLDYKNYTAGSFGTYASAVTGGQYESIAKAYPGVVDAIIRSQRTINPQDLRWMNVMQVSILTSDPDTPWLEAQNRQYIDYLQRTSMYAARFLLTPPQPINVDLKLQVFCFNSAQSLSYVQEAVEAAVRQLFKPRPGLLGTAFHHSDIIETAMNAVPGSISYVIVNNPKGSMLVELPVVSATADIIQGGSLQPGAYAYSVTATVPDPDVPGGTTTPPPSVWVYPTVTLAGGIVRLRWPLIPDAISYTVWGRRADKLQIMEIIPQPLLGATIGEFLDGGTMPDPAESLPFLSAAPKIRYNRLSNVTVEALYTDRMTTATYPIRDIAK